MNNQKPIQVTHKWTEQEKRINCAICLLGSAMKDCKACAFFGTHTKIDTVSKLSSASQFILISIR